jgi:hypothetical protein
LFQLFNYEEALAALLKGFDEEKANATKKVSAMLRRFYPSISSKSKKEKSGSQTQGKNSRGGNSHALDTIQEHEAALMLHGYKIVAPMKNVMSLPLAVNWG